MSKVVDRPELKVPPVEGEKLDPKKPIRYHIEAWSPGRFCAGKFMMVVTEVFDVPLAVAGGLSSAMKTYNKVPVALDMTLDIAEAKAAMATKRMDELVDGCHCGSRLKFIPVPAA